MRQPILLPILCAVLTACNISPAPPLVGSFDGTAYVPVYINAEDATKVTAGPPQDIEDPGKIHLREPYIFINDKGRGIHIIDNTDDTAPRKVAFINIPGNLDMAVKGQFLYADNLTDLLTFDISNPENIRMIKRIPDAFPVRDFPPQVNVHFECVDKTKGIVIGWEKVKMVQKPKCWR